MNEIELAADYEYPAAIWKVIIPSVFLVHVITLRIHKDFRRTELEMVHEWIDNGWGHKLDWTIENEENRKNEEVMF